MLVFLRFYSIFVGSESLWTPSPGAQQLLTDSRDDDPPTAETLADGGNYDRHRIWDSDASKMLFAPTWADAMNTVNDTYLAVL